MGLNIEVHGTIWLVEQMILSNKVTVDVASTAFDDMKKAGSRLPWDVVEKTLNKYK